MLTKISSLSATALLMTLLLVPNLAAEAIPWHLSFDLGVRQSDVAGDSTKLEEYRDLGNGVLLDEVWLELDQENSPYRFLFLANHVGRRDEESSLHWSQAGRFRLDAQWNRIPHTLARHAVNLFQVDGSVLSLPDPLQLQVENFFTSTPAPTTAQAREFMTSLLQQAGRRKELATRRETARLDFEYDLNRQFELAVFGQNVDRRGQGRIGTGTYIRRQTVGSFDRNRFEPRGTELILPVDNRTKDFGFAANFHEARFLASAGWQRSTFSNSFSSLTWDNPFEGTPGATSSATGLNPGFEQEPSGATANTGNRNRFPVAQLALDPDNEFERLFGSASLTLPRHTRFSVTYAAANTKQNSDFLPYTLNPAVIFANGPDGKGGTADDLLAKDVALPKASLDGEVETTRWDVRLTSRPLDRLALRGNWRRYEYDNRTPTILFPGFAAAGDSYFRPGIGQRDASGVRVLFNQPGSYSRSAWSTGATLNGGSQWTFDLEYGVTDWEYEERQVEATSEDQLAARLRLSLGDRFELRLSYLDASREAEGDYHIGFETSRLRAFDVWNRERTRLGAELAMMIGDRGSVGISYQDWQDEYPGVVPIPSPIPASNPFPSLPYGLNETSNESYALTYGYGDEVWELSGAVGVEETGWESLAVAKTSLTGDSPQFDPINRWVRNQQDDVLWASLSADVKLNRKARLQIELDWHDYDGEYLTVNPQTPNVNDGQAYAVPDFSSRLFTSQVSFDYELTEQLGLVVNYLYEPYRLDDWQWDLVEPYMQGILKETGGSPAAIRDNPALRMLFLDATYTDYTAHVLSLYMSLEF